MRTETATKDVPVGPGMKVKTNIKAGGIARNHNQTVSKGMRVKSNVKAGDSSDRIFTNHNQIVARGMRVKSGMKGGFNPQPEPPGLRIKSNVKAGGIVIPQ